MRLVNTSATQARRVLLQAGAFGEHRFTKAAYESRTSVWPGDLGGYAGTYHAEPIARQSRTLALENGRLQVDLPAGTEIRLDLDTQRYVTDPSYATPF